MALVDQITQEMKTAMKAKDKERLAAIRLIRARIIELSKEGGEFGDADVVKALRSMVKQRKDAAQQYVDGGRPELAETELYEVSVIEDFLPKLADEATTQKWVQEAIASSGASSPKDMGRAMGALMKAHKDEVDGGLARKLLSTALSEA